MTSYIHFHMFLKLSIVDFPLFKVDDFSEDKDEFNEDEGDYYNFFKTLNLLYVFFINLHCLHCC